MPKTLNPVTPIEVRESIKAYHEKMKSWRQIATIIQMSPSYAQRVAEGKLNASEAVINRWLAYQQVNDLADVRKIANLVQITVHDDEAVIIQVHRRGGDGTHEVIELT